ncbi:hypothetical protein SK128_013235 [Halocaridina rubra]|uniref:Uncharacterized protein n=1 Tax=Halocaridina rubra TaxID=373956 RepID=A0AAN8WPT0_HALRR
MKYASMTPAIRYLFLLQYVLQGIWAQIPMLNTGHEKEELNKSNLPTNFISNRTNISTEQTLTNTDQASESPVSIKLTYNTTKSIFGVPRSGEPLYEYEIWFKPMKAKAMIDFKFDFSLNGNSNLEDLGPSFSYEIQSLEWHKTQIPIGKYSNTTCDSWAELKIPTINTYKCLPHHTISRVQVSSNYLVLWSTLPPQALWLVEDAIKSPGTDTTTVLVLASFLVATLLGLAGLGTYVWHLRATRNKGETGQGERVYEEWNAIRAGLPYDPVTPSSSSQNFSGSAGTAITYLHQVTR